MNVIARIAALIRGAESRPPEWYETLPEKATFDPGDMSRPVNWTEGDILRCVESAIHVTKGRVYKVAARDLIFQFGFHQVWIEADDTGTQWPYRTGLFRFEKRP